MRTISSVRWLTLRRGKELTEESSVDLTLGLARPNTRRKEPAQAHVAERADAGARGGKS